jgi:hypothetical protein
VSDRNILMAKNSALGNGKKDTDTTMDNPPREALSDKQMGYRSTTRRFHVEEKGLSSAQGIVS